MTQPPVDQSGPTPWIPGSGTERRSGRDRRARQRRNAPAAVPEDRRAGRDRRLWEERRGAFRRRSVESLAAGTSGAAGPAGSVERERARARRLLDEFTRLSGPAEQRVAKLVRRQWPAYPLGARAFLAERLTGLLRSVPEGTALTDDVRREVEEVVADWAARL